MRPANGPTSKPSAARKFTALSRAAVKAEQRRRALL
jgi:hypothetical protein